MSPDRTYLVRVILFVTGNSDAGPSDRMDPRSPAAGTAGEVEDYDDDDWFLESLATLPRQPLGDHLDYTPRR